MFDGHSTYGSRPDYDRKAQAENRARQLYRDVSSQARWQQIWSTLTRRSRQLVDLETAQASYTVLDHRYTGKQMVPISQIRGSGSSGRSGDFDANFRPLNNRTRTRWLNVATAWQSGSKLPPVELIQIGETYFVEDGHHRISVAQAFGRTEIEAKVTVLEVA